MLGGKAEKTASSSGRCEQNNNSSKQKNMFIMYTFKHCLSKCGPERNIAEDGPAGQLSNTSSTLPAAEMDKNDTM